ncbi:MAG TPA: alpha-L-rhamnosidase C-terminal domain-containing protein, partial [Thermoleophilaceae bacterium]|nr:alpha-L-rhamnosidase C-terminal domain-containing protein [Thermoleophilaceae bacterium]
KPSDELGPIRGAYPFGTDAHPWSRVDIFEPPSEATVFESAGKRESRYLLITLDGPGVVEIEHVQIRQAIYPVNYDGHFLCSDDLLNRAWYHSAYTQELATLSEKSDLEGANDSGPDGASPWMLAVPLDRVLFIGDVVWQAQAGYQQSSDFHWMVRNTVNAFPSVQYPNGAFPCASSHLVKPASDPSAEPDGWQSPKDGPDPDLAVGFVGAVAGIDISGGRPSSLVHEIKLDQFTPAWLTILADNFLYGGDADFVRPLLPVARRVVDFFRSMTNEHGLHREPEDQRLNPEAEFALRWNWDPPAIATGVDSYTNAAWYDAIKGLALLEEHVAGRPDEAAKLREEAEALRQALIEHLWDAEVGAMILNDEDQRRDHTSDANVMQLAFRTLDPERAEAAMAFLEAKLGTPFGTRNSEYEGENPYRPGPEMHAFLTSIEQLGRMRYGDGERAVESIRNHWAHMLDNGPGTGWYMVSPDGSPGSHRCALTSWTTAVPALSEGVLGIRPTAPGFSEWVVAPQLCGLDWADGCVPTPDGGISVRWRRTDKGGFQLTVSAPEQTRGEVAVPTLGEDREIAMDGQTVWANRTAAGGANAELVDDTVIFRDISGQHTFAWI